MSLLRAIKAQLGLSGTPANNFTLDASADNGTMKLARGNAGATTQDIMTVAANGTISFPQMAQSLGQSGYVKLPGGLIIQWGKASVNASGNASVTFPIAFSQVYAVTTSPSPDSGFTETQLLSSNSSSVTNIGMQVSIRFIQNSGPVSASVWPVSWIAVGA